VSCGSVLQQVPVPPPIPVQKSNTVAIVLAICGGIVGVIAIIGILAAIAIPNFIAYRQKAFDAQAETFIMSACTEAQGYFLEYAADTITYDTLTERGVNIPPEIEFHIEDPTRENLTMTARHMNGDQIFVSDKECNIEAEYP
jgi:Tfp pilus assembly protein PilE